MNTSEVIMAKMALAEDLRHFARLYAGDLTDADIIDVLHDVVGDLGGDVPQDVPTFIRAKREART
jgi:hypothetical protein